jgi:chromosome segregation ATPase
MAFYSTFFPLLSTADALTMANARISSLEAELEASRKAWDAATAAKVAAEKSAKLAAAKAKKAEKALADADQGRVQREQAITKRLNQISTLAGGKYRAVYFFAHFSVC